MFTSFYFLTSFFGKFENSRIFFNFRYFELLMFAAGSFIYSPSFSFRFFSLRIIDLFTFSIFFVFFNNLFSTFFPIFFSIYLFSYSSSLINLFFAFFDSNFIITGEGGQNGAYKFLILPPYFTSIISLSV